MSTTTSRPRLALALFSAVVAVGLAVPAASNASVIDCSGRVQKVETEDTLGYSFRCADPILAYSLTFDQEIGGFEPEVPILDGSGRATNELFSCEGDIPSFGIACFGTNTVGYHEFQSTVDLPRDACDSPRYKAYLFVVTSAKGQMGGPFPLRGTVGCDEKVGPIKRLLAWIELLKAEAR